MKRSPKGLKIVFFGKESDSFWRPVPPAEILPEDQSSLSSQSPSCLFSKEQPLQHCRRNLSASLSDYFRTWTHRDFSSPQAQWCVSILDGIAGLSKSDHVTSFSPAHGALRSQPIKKAPKQDAFADDAETGITEKDHFRFGLHRSDPLWETGTRGDRLQSCKEGSAILSSLTLFQWDYQRFLAWGTAAGRYPYFDGCSGRRCLRSGSVDRGDD